MSTATNNTISISTCYTEAIELLSMINPNLIETLPSSLHGNNNTLTPIARFRASSKLAKSLNSLGGGGAPIVFSPTWFLTSSTNSLTDLRRVLEWIHTLKAAIRVNRKSYHHQQQQQNIIESEKYQLLNQLQQLTLQTQTTLARAQRLETLVSSQRQRNSELKQAIEIEQRATQLSEADHEGNTIKMKEIVENSKSRLVSLAQEWEIHRTRLVQKLYVVGKSMEHISIANAKKQEEELKFSRQQELLKKELYDLDKKIAIETKIATTNQNSGLMSSSTSPKNVTTATATSTSMQELRSTVVTRVFDCTEQLRRQDREINELENEITSLQKEISFASERLQRTETVVDDKIYKLACMDDAHIPTYEFLLQIRESFDKLITLENSAYASEMDSKRVARERDAVASRVHALDFHEIERLLEEVKNSGR
jgi:hypothetical protein